MKKNHYLNWIFTFLLIFPLMLLVGCGNNNNNTKTLVAISVETKNLDSEIFEVDMLSKTITSTYDKELTTIIDNKNFNVYLRYSDNSTEKIEPVSNNNFYGYKFQTTVPDIEDGETVSAGSYSLKFIYGELSDTFVWNINKKTIDMSSADWISCANFRYNAEEYEVYVNKINEIEGIEYSYDIQGNQLKATNAGAYTAKINISYDETNYTLINAPASEYKWSIKKGNIADYIDVSNLWTYSEPFVYENGITYEVEFLKENLDDKFGLEIIDYDINLSNNKTNTAMNAGTYVAGVIVEQNDLNNWNVFNSKLLNLVWVINKKEINLGKIGVKWPNYEDAIFIYDGTQKKMELIGLEDNEFGISARYEVDISNNITSKATNSGHYISKSRFVYDNRNYILTNLPASEFGWIIEKRVLNIEDFEDAEWVYNNESLVYKPGFKHIVTLENLPSMINGVDYFKNVESNVTNMATNAGDYTAFAILDYDSNYEIDYEVQQEILTHNWTIEKASINIENKWINDAPYYYDEQSKSVSFDINQDAFNNGIVSLKGYSGITQAVQSGVYHCYAIIDVVDEDNYNQIEGNFSYSWEILNCECIEEVVLSGGGISQPKTYNQEWFENLLYIPYLNTITISPNENFYIKVNGESTNEVYAETKQGIYEIEIYRNSDDKLIFKKTLKTIIIDNVVIDNKEYYVDGNIINCESLNQLADSVCINIGKDKISNVDYSMKFAGRLKYSYVDKDSLDTIYINIESQEFNVPVDIDEIKIYLDDEYKYAIRIKKWTAIERIEYLSIKTNGEANDVNYATHTDKFIINISDSFLTNIEVVLKESFMDYRVELVDSKGEIVFVENFVDATIFNDKFIIKIYNELEELVYTYDLVFNISYLIGIENVEKNDNETLELNTNSSEIDLSNGLFVFEDGSKIKTFSAVGEYNFNIIVSQQINEQVYAYKYQLIVNYSDN